MKNKMCEALQLFAYDNNNYCDFTSTAAKAVAGKNILLCIFYESGENLLADRRAHV